jgi:hypothetical protein
LFAGLTVKFPRVERFLKVVKDVQAIISGEKVDSAVGRFTERVLSGGRLEFDLDDRIRFPLGRLGLYCGDDEEGEGW